MNASYILATSDQRQSLSLRKLKTLFFFFRYTYDQVKTVCEMTNQQHCEHCDYSYATGIMKYDGNGSTFDENDNGDLLYCQRIAELFEDE
jgi:hypothetical protein